MNGLVTAAYIGATVLFILALGGLSHQETARRGNLYGMLGMGMALVAAFLGVVTANYGILILALVVGGAFGLVLARRVQMTQMPELVAILHSLVGLAAVLVGFANFMDPATHHVGVEKTIHDVDAMRRGIHEGRSEEHTSALPSREKIVCRLLPLEKKLNQSHYPGHET